MHNCIVFIEACENLQVGLVQIKYGPHVVIWKACKKRLISMKLVIDVGPIHGNAYKLAAVLPVSI